jgi:DNA-binding Lrp family transcriptional regulator
MNALDRTDLRMLAVLQGEGRITNAELAERVSLSPSACLRRLQRLESDKIITGYAAQVDPQAVGLGLQAFVRVQLTKHESAAIEASSSASTAGTKWSPVMRSRATWTICCTCMSPIYRTSRASCSIICSTPRASPTSIPVSCCARSSAHLHCR